jgi:hypothetical protein
MDIGPGAVVLTEVSPFKRNATVESTEWIDNDDETPTDNLVKLISTGNKGVFPKISATSSGGAKPGTQSGDAKLYFLGKAAYPNLDPPTGSTATEVVDANVDAFISGLPPGYIGLVPDSDKTDTILNVKDIWGYYMSAGLISTEITVSTSNDPIKKPPFIKQVSMSCKLLGDGLNFSTAHNEDQFNGKGFATMSNDKVTISSSTGVVICGLDPTSQLSGINLVTLLEKFRLSDPDKKKKSAVSKLIDKLGEEVTMKLIPCDIDPVTSKPKPVETRDAYRNAIWCFADVC